MDRKWRALIIVCVAIFMLLLDITIVNVALPRIQKELHASFTDLQWVVDAYALTLATTMLNAGSLGDLLGRKRVFIVGVALFTAASAACGAATSPVFLNLARGAQGIGGAIMFAVSLAILSQEFHGKERGTAFGIWGATIGAAVAIGPLVGGVLTKWLGWRWIFFVNIPIGVALVFFGMRVLVESRDETHGGIDIPGLLTLSGGLFALVLALLRGNDWGWSSGRGRRSSQPRSSSSSGFTFIELRPGPADVRLRALPRADVRRRADRRVHDLVRDVLAVPLPDALPPERARLLADPGRAALPAALARLVLRRAVVGTLVGDRADARAARPRAALNGVALLLMHGVTSHSGWTTLLPGFIVGGIGIGLVNPPLASTAVSVVEPRRAGMASGINNTFRQVGIATGIAGLGAIFQSRIQSKLHGVGSAKAVASGAVHQGGELARAAFVSGLNEILLVAAFVAFAGAVLALVLVRDRDFVASGPAASS